MHDDPNPSDGAVASRKTLGMIVYNLLYGFLRTLLLVLSPILNHKTKAWINLRNNQDLFEMNKNVEGQKIWVHASSGEIEYAKSFIREFKKAFPKTQIYVSYSSLSAPSLFKNISSEVTAFFPLNWDTTKDNVKLLNFIQPGLIIFSRTDYWPNLIQQALAKNIRLATIAANPKPTFLSSMWLKFCCDQFKFLSCVEENQVQYLQQILPAVKIEYIPDTRFDQVFYRLQQNTLVQLDVNKKYLTLGSTWAKDNAIIKPIAKDLIAKGYALVWAPHDIKYAQQLFSEIKTQLPNFKVILLADYKSGENFDVLIVDRIGVLADLYRFSKISFVGGSFVSKVHSVMEPLCAGNFVIVGPYYTNNPEATAFQNINLVKSVHNQEQFIEAVNYFEKNQDQLTELKRRTQSKQGGSLKTVQAIAEILKF